MKIVPTCAKPVAVARVKYSLAAVDQYQSASAGDPPRDVEAADTQPTLHHRKQATRPRMIMQGKGGVRREPLQGHAPDAIVGQDLCRARPAFVDQQTPHIRHGGPPIGGVQPVRTVPLKQVEHFAPHHASKPALQPASWLAVLPANPDEFQV